MEVQLPWKGIKNECGDISHEVGWFKGVLGLYRPFYIREFTGRGISFFGELRCNRRGAMIFAGWG